MSLPDLIEIIPPREPVQACVTVPGSKSITNRALMLAALADGEVTLHGALWSEDTQVMVECLRDLGFMVNVTPDPNESCNRTVSVYGRGGEVPRGGMESQPLELFVGNAGTAARFLSAMVCLGEGVYRLHGVPRMHERPQSSLFQALRELGYRIDSQNDRLPALIHGGGKRRGTCRVSIEESSQFASALLLGARYAPWTIEVVGENAEESPYVAMTSNLIKAFPYRGGSFQIEPDASSGGYFLAADWVLWIGHGLNERLNMITVRHWPDSGWQIDQEYIHHRNLHDLCGGLSRKDDLGDSIMMAIVQSPLNLPASRPGGAKSTDPSSTPPPLEFRDLGRLRVQETERVKALMTELEKCGARIEEEEDTLRIYSGVPLHGAEIDTYHDHRMAMCFAILGLKVPGIKIRNPSCVKKTFPNFFQKLAAPLPQGLGVEIRDAQTGAMLETSALFAD